MSRKPFDPMKRKPPVEFTPERKAMFLEHFRKHGLQWLAAEYAGVRPETVQDHKRKDEVFAELYEAAKEAQTDDMIREAQRRAVEGVDEPIIGGKFKDEVVTTVKRYSDRLLETLLRSRREEFRNNAKIDASVSGGVLVLPSSNPTIDDWEKEHGEAAKGMPEPGEN